MKKLLFMLLVLCMVFSLQARGTSESGGAGAAAQGSRETIVKEITWARPYETTSMDPAEAADDNSTNIVSYTTEGLTRIVDGLIVPGIAERWDASEDGRTFTFYLRKSVWSDGSPFTAGDFVYSFFRLIDPKQGHSQASGGYGIANAQAYAEGTAERDSVGFRALDDYTLEVTFRNTGLENLHALADSVFCPVKQSIADAVGSAYGSDRKNFLGNGPFVVTEWLHENRIVLEKNPLYWNADAINLTKMTGIANVEDDTAVELLLTGTVDLARFREPRHYEPLVADGFKDTPFSNSYTFLHINHRGRNGDTGRFLANQNFRRALNFALDRTALVLSVLPGHQAAFRLADPNMPGANGYFVDEYPLGAGEGLNLTADREKAREYLNLALAELGATLAEVPEFSLLCFESQASQLVLQACQDMFLTNLGIRSAIDPQPIQQMLGKVFSFNYDFWYGGMGSGSMDIASNDGILNYWDSSNPNNLFAYSNETYNALLETAQSTLDIKERKDAVAELEKIFCAEIPDLLLIWQTVHAVYRDGIELNGISKAYGPDLAFADVTKNR